MHTCSQALEQDRYSLRRQLALQTKYKDDALEEVVSVELRLTAEHQSLVKKLKDSHNCKVDQLTKQVHLSAFIKYLM